MDLLEQVKTIFSKCKKYAKNGNCLKCKVQNCVFMAFRDMAVEGLQAAEKEHLQRAKEVSAAIDELYDLTGVISFHSEVEKIAKDALVTGTGSGMVSFKKGKVSVRHIEIKEPEYMGMSARELIELIQMETGEYNHIKWDKIDFPSIVAIYQKVFSKEGVCQEKK